ncbi:hypothetical protein OSB04_012705 [Centaurea solstitialis]|uniref:Uncharacterized protein n=1 Tax=Centaurea solstitialis TaxID=347529 RepID=A0AA38TPT8_9ASTR|nr:hypothetical protein OSB04_012705 [Centaurea solstitialis]
MIITGSDSASITILKQSLSANSAGTYLCQAKYTSDLISRAGITDQKVVSTPLEPVDPALLRPDEMIMILNLYLVNRFQDQDQETNEPVLQSTDPVH